MWYCLLLRLLRYYGYGMMQLCLSVMYKSFSPTIRYLFFALLTSTELSTDFINYLIFIKFSKYISEKNPKPIENGSAGQLKLYLIRGPRFVQTWLAPGIIKKLRRTSLYQSQERFFFRSINHEFFLSKRKIWKISKIQNSIDSFVWIIKCNNFNSRHFLPIK